MSRFFADFHIHSRFSVATSKNLVPEQLEYWARLKGLSVIGTGDIAHPGWLAELREKLEPAGNGLYRLRDEYRIPASRELDHPEIPRDVNFLLTGEISSIYKRAGKVRKVHNIVIMNGFDAAEELQARLGRLGNITSDGRPILGVDSRDILAMTLESGAGSYLIPAHIWTPWFSVLGSKSGFDSIEECYGDLSSEIVALETGLSSDPAMNRCCSMLDGYRLVSNSDAHSPEKLGREATVFEGEHSFDFLYQALKTGTGYRGTVEFFPEEGKYHLDGHRKCGIVWNPLETARHNGMCPVCGHEVTRGVMYRVAELADRPLADAKVEEFVSITQLADLLAEMHQVKNSQSKKISELYHRLVRQIGSEFYLLLEAPLELLEKEGGELFAEGIRRLRAKEVICEDGYDGEFGRVSVFSSAETSVPGNRLFSQGTSATRGIHRPGFNFDIEEFRSLAGRGSDPAAATETPRERLNESQTEAVSLDCTPVMVLSGPGTGKTRVLVERILSILEKEPDATVAAVTFTNRAAAEISERLGAGDLRLFTGTFHSLGLSIMNRCGLPPGLAPGFAVIGDEERREIALALSPKNTEALIRDLDRFREGTSDVIDEKTYEGYRAGLNGRTAIDILDCIYLPVAIMRGDLTYRKKAQELFRHIMVDEFQDINALQYELIRLLAGDRESGLFVIGDPDQSIYSFRGASPLFMERFIEDFPASMVINLSRSYRAPESYLKGATQVIQKNFLLTGKSGKFPLVIHGADTDRAEADWIAASIEAELGGVRSFSRDSAMSDGENRENRSPDEIAILCRASFMFPVIEKALADHGIPYRKAGDEPFWILEPYRSAINVIARYHYNRHYPSRFDHVPPEVIDRIDNDLELDVTISMLMEANRCSSSEIEKLTALARHPSQGVRAFLNRLALLEAIDVPGLSHAVSLMTIHASKGLEFASVYVAGCEEGVLPFTLFGTTDIGEEERLLYVAMTRSSERLRLSWAKNRQHRGKNISGGESRFLSRIGLELKERASRESRQRDDDQLTLFKE